MEENLLELIKFVDFEEIDKDRPFFYFFEKFDLENTMFLIEVNYEFCILLKPKHKKISEIENKYHVKDLYDTFQIKHLLKKHYDIFIYRDDSYCEGKVEIIPINKIQYFYWNMRDIRISGIEDSIIINPPRRNFYYIIENNKRNEKLNIGRGSVFEYKKNITLQNKNCIYYVNSLYVYIPKGKREDELTNFCKIDFDYGEIINSDEFVIKDGICDMEDHAFYYEF